MTPDGPIQRYQGSYLTPAFEHATVGDAMHHGVLTCGPDATLTDVARILATHHVHAIVVLGDTEPGGGGLTWSVLSDLDVAAAAGLREEEPTAGELAATPAATVQVGDPLHEAVRLMREHDVHHLVVVSGRNPRPVGVLSCLDVAGVLAWGRA